MPSVGPTLPVSATGNTNTVGAGTRIWTNPGQITIADGTNAIVSFLAAAANSDDLIGFSFGFSLGASAVVDGILLEINYTDTTFGGGLTESIVKLMKAGVAVGTNKSTGASLPNPSTTASYGGSSDLWGTTWTPSDINNNGFGAVFVVHSGGVIESAGVDFFRITVFFHNVFSDGLNFTSTPSISESQTLKMPVAMSTSATTGFQDNNALVMSATMSLSNTAGFADTGTDIPGTPSLNLSLTPAVVISGVNVLGTQALAFSSTSGFNETAAIGGSRGIVLQTNPSAFMNADITGTPLLTADAYPNLVTSEHNKRPNFMAMIQQDVQGYVDNINLLRSFSTLFDIDQAVGQQLDMIGVWIGISRNIQTPLQGVYFAFNTTNLGFNVGTWFGIGDSVSGVTVLSDGQYMLLLKAKIASNHWDGTVPGAYAIWAVVFESQGFNILIHDGQDMTMAIIIVGQNIPAVTLSLLTNGYIALRPAGVLIFGYYQISVPNVPIFGFGIENATIAGFNDGAWVEKIG